MIVKNCNFIYSARGGMFPDLGNYFVAAKNIRQMAQTLEFFVSYFQFCLFMFGTISQRGMHAIKKPSHINNPW